MTAGLVFVEGMGKIKTGKLWGLFSQNSAPMTSDWISYRILKLERRECVPQTYEINFETKFMTICATIYNFNLNKFYGNAVVKILRQ